MKSLPKDEYGHVTLPDANTDPYGDLEFAVGNGDDFHCFDYAIFEHKKQSYIVLHSVINSETGAFIQDGEYLVMNLEKDFEGEVLAVARNLVGSALDWCAEGGGDKPIRHSNKGWNQDPYYFVRAVARAIYRHGVQCEALASMSRRASWFRFGSKTLNRAIQSIAPMVGFLPVTRQPRRA